MTQSACESRSSLPVRIAWPGRLAALPSMVVALWGAMVLRWVLTDTVIPWDSKNQFYTFFRFMAEAIAQGSTPFWNPYHYAGHPSIADPQSMIFAPAFVLWALVDPHPSLFALHPSPCPGTGFRRVCGLSFALPGNARHATFHHVVEASPRRLSTARKSAVADLRARRPLQLGKQRAPRIGSNGGDRTCSGAEAETMQCQRCCASWIERHRILNPPAGRLPT